MKYTSSSLADVSFRRRDPIYVPDESDQLLGRSPAIYFKFCQYFSCIIDALLLRCASVYCI